MKLIALTSAIALAASSAFAGKLAAPAADPIVVAPIVEEAPAATGSNLSWIVPAAAVLLIGAAIAASDDDDDDNTTE